VTTAAEFVRQVRERYLSQGTHEIRNRLNGALDDSTEAIAWQYAEPGGIVPGLRLSIDFEDLYVWTAGSLSGTAERGYEGTTAVAHDDGALIRVAPRFTDNQIVLAGNEAIAELQGRKVRRVAVEEITWSDATSSYAIPAAVDQVLTVAARTDDSAIGWPIVHDWTVQRGHDIADDFSTGVAILFTNQGGYHNQPIRVTYTKAFGSFTNASSSIETDTGWSASAMELLKVSTALNLLAGREVGRNFSEAQGNPRRAEEVPQGAEVQSLRPLVTRQTTLLNAELARHARLYPHYRPR
jgi:hypothetical protein